MKTIMKLMVVGLMSVVAMNVLPSAKARRSIPIKNWEVEGQSKTFSIQGLSASNVRQFERLVSEFEAQSNKLLQVRDDKSKSNDDFVNEAVKLRAIRYDLFTILENLYEAKIASALKILNSSAASKEGGAQAIIEDAKAALQ